MSRAIVVGGGLAGLVAARHLSEAGLDVQVFERCDEVGGRVRTLRREGFTLDRGFEDFRLLHTDRVPFAQPPGIHAELPGPNAPGGHRYLAGDYTRWSSIQAALRSGKRAVNAVLERQGSDSKSSRA